MVSNRVPLSTNPYTHTIIPLCFDRILTNKFISRLLMARTNSYFQRLYTEKEKKRPAYIIHTHSHTVIGQHNAKRRTPQTIWGSLWWVTRRLCIFMLTYVLLEIAFRGFRRSTQTVYIYTQWTVLLSDTRWGLLGFRFGSFFGFWLYNWIMMKIYIYLYIGQMVCAWRIREDDSYFRRLNRKSRCDWFKTIFLSNI